MLLVFVAFFSSFFLPILTVAGSGYYVIESPLPYTRNLNLTFFLARSLSVEVKINRLTTV